MNKTHLLISGRVQGVTFRANTKSKAQSLDLKGWVRNTDDGKVEAVVEGEKEKIKELIEWAHKGPILAKVDNVEVQWEDEQEGFEKFKVRY